MWYVARYTRVVRLAAVRVVGREARRCGHLRQRLGRVDLSRVGCVGVRDEEATTAEREHEGTGVVMVVDSNSYCIL